MYNIHLTEEYREKVANYPLKDAIFDRLKNYISLTSDPKNVGSISSFPKDMLVYKKGYDCRVVLQKKELEIDNHSVKVLFVRDFISGQDIDYYWGRKAFVQLKKGIWLDLNPLAEKEIDHFIENYKNTDHVGKKAEIPPVELNSWLNDYQLKIYFDVFETENWVKYSTNRGVNGLEEKYILSFKRLFSSVFNKNQDSIIIPISKSDNIFYAVNRDDRVAILYGDYQLKRRIILIYGGAHINLQKEKWEELLGKAERGELQRPKNEDLESISKEAFRAYPKWVLNNNDSEDLWSLIQRSKGINNLSLLPEQINFLQKFNFPYYINGQAGSGKSTMLYYIFANVYYYKCAGMFDGDIVFLTENKNLIKETQKAIVSLLQLNPQFSDLALDDIGKVRSSLKSFKDFLLGILPKESRNKYKDKYLDFGIFKNKYNKHYQKKYSAEEVWFVITTYVYGYFEDKEIDTSEKYFKEIPSKFQLIKDSQLLTEILQEGLPFYQKLLNDGWWDKNTIVREIRKIFPDKLPKQYTVIFCDEAQDFSRIELRLIIESSVYMNYDLSRPLQQVPIVFAGDALQTVNPVGFSVDRLHQMFYDILREKGFTYSKKESTYNPTYNYRSIQPIVRVANIIQCYRSNILEDKGLKQDAKIQDSQTSMPIIYPIEWLQEDKETLQKFKSKFKFKSFIIPIDLNEEEEYQEHHELISDGYFADIKSSIAAKGAEYAQVVVFGFGDQYLKNYGKLEWVETNKTNFKIKFFFNKLYVAVTRAQKELVIIDSQNAIDNFWSPLLSQNTENPWEELELHNVVNINPETLHYILDSNKEDALENAKIDFELGIKDNNVSRLSVAANIFFQLGENGQAYECEAYRALIKGDWQKAGSNFIKANNLEEAAKTFFKNEAWQDLRLKIDSLRSEKQELRILIASFMQQGEWSPKELLRVTRLRTYVDELLQSVPWRFEFINKIIKYTTKISSLQAKRDLTYILEAFVKDDENELLLTIASNYYETKQYSYAIDFWDRISEKQTEENYEIPIKDLPFYTDYAHAHIEKAKEEGEFKSEIIWSGRLAMHEETPKEQRYKLTKKILDNYFEKNEVLLEITPKEEVLQYVYLSLILHLETEQLHFIGAKFENCETLSNQDLLHTYKYLIYFSDDEDISLFLKERWVKIYLSQYKNPIENLDKLNEEYKNYNFPFEEEKDFNWTIKMIEEISTTPSPIPIDPPNYYQSFLIENFRGFKKLEIQNIGQFNLILGNNNVGKTSLLEAFTMSNDVNNTCKNFIYLHKQRNQIFNIYEIFDSFLYNKAEEVEIAYTIKSGRRKWQYKLTIPSNRELSKYLGNNNENNYGYLLLNSSKKKKGVLSDKMSIIEKQFLNDSMQDIHFIPFGKGYSNDLVSIYYDSIGRFGKKVKDDFRDSVMKLFIPNIVEIDVDPKNDEIMIEEKDTPKLALYNYGEGANKLFRIMVQLYAAEGKRLMIDEIDAGIHYSKFKNFWKIILRAAKEKEVQLFASTHNEECITHFIEAINELEQDPNKEIEDYFSNKARIITLEQHTKTQEIIPLVRNFERMEYAQGYELDLRGRKS